MSQVQLTLNQFGQYGESSVCSLVCLMIFWLTVKQTDFVLFFTVCVYTSVFLISPCLLFIILMSLPQSNHTACLNPTKINPETSSYDKRKLTVSHDESPLLKACLNPQNSSDGSAHPLQGASQPKPRGIAGHSNMTASYLNTLFTENLHLNDNTENDIEENNLPNLMDQYLETAQINQLSFNGSFRIPSLHYLLILGLLWKLKILTN